MALSLEQIMKINVDIDYNDPILSKVTTSAMIKYVESLGFSPIKPKDSISVYKHKHVKCGRSHFSILIPDRKNHHDVSTYQALVVDFISNMCRFYQARSKESVSQLQILSYIL